MQHEISSQL